MTSLFTVLVQFRGDTQIGQWEAESPHAAISAYVARMRSDKSAPKALNKLAKAIERTTADEYSPLPVNGLVNVWFAVESVDEDMVMIHVFRMAR